MAKITRPAIELRQGNLTLYLTHITPADLKIPNFYNVDKLDIAEQQGFQRMLDARRAQDLAKDLAEAFPEGYASLPTTVFLATNKDISFDAKAGEINFDTDVVCPLSVVDGQHRIEGLKRSLEIEPGLKDFQLPTTIAVGLDDVHQMFHFFVVNTNQKPVDGALTQQITARFTEMHGVKELPYLPKKLKGVVSKGVEELAVNLVKFLNENPDSPLCGLIHMANTQKSKSHRVAQKSFVNILERHVLHPSNDMYSKERVRSDNRMNQIMLNYFSAVDSLLVDPGNRETTRLYNNNGIYFLCQISKWTFQQIYNTPDADFTIPSITKVISGALENLETECLHIGDKDRWLPTPPTFTLTRQNADQFANAYLRALQVSAHYQTDKAV